MLRAILTLGVGFALLVALGAWFRGDDPREAAEAEVVAPALDLAEEAAAGARDAAREAVDGSADAAPPERQPPTPAAGPRPRKKPPVVAAAAPTVPEEVEEVRVAARREFQEAPLEAASGDESAAVARPEDPATPPDPGEQASLIRRMLALYDRVVR